MVRFLNCNQATLLSHWAMNPRAHPEAFEQIMKQQKAYNKNMVPKKAICNCSKNKNISTQVIL